LYDAIKRTYKAFLLKSLAICQVHGLSYKSPIVGTFPEIVS